MKIHKIAPLRSERTQHIFAQVRTPNTFKILHTFFLLCLLPLQIKIDLIFVRSD